MFLRGELTILHSLDTSHAKTLYEMAKESDAHKFTTPFWRPWGLADFEAFVGEGRAAERGRLRLGISVADDSSASVVGVIELHNLDWLHGRAEIGITIWPSHARGKGYGPDAVRTLCRWGFNTLRLRRLYCKVFSSNVGAQHTFEKVGFRQEGTWRQHFFLQGHTEDAILYGILASELTD